MVQESSTPSPSDRRGNASRTRETTPGFAAWVRTLLLGTALVPTIVLLGWTFEIERMKRIAPGLTSMNPVTALCFLLAALAMWPLRAGPAQGRARKLVWSSAAAILFVGLSKIVDLLSGTTICPDDLLFVTQLDRGQEFPSRMAPNVAASFCVLAVVLLAFDRPGWPRWLHPQYLVTLVLALALAALIGYAYDTTGFYKYKQYIPMALHSALCFGMVSLAVILSRPQQGYMRLLQRGSQGARLFVRLLPACILIPAILGGLQVHGSESGWFSGRGMGTSIVAVVTIFALSVLAFFNAAAVSRAERVQLKASQQLHALVAELDHKNQALLDEIVERKRMEAQAKHEATHDPLTGLPNRMLFVDRLQLAISRTARTGSACALFYVDINDFKPINDRHGHMVGDALLRSIATRFKDSTRSVDTVARLGGDEFAVIVDQPPDHDHALMLARRIVDAVGRPHRIVQPDGEVVELSVTLSVGIAIFPSHAADLDDLVRVADGAMYRAKDVSKRRGLPGGIEFASDPRSPGVPQVHAVTAS